MGVWVLVRISFVVLSFESIYDYDVEVEHYIHL